MISISVFATASDNTSINISADKEKSEKETQNKKESVAPVEGTATPKSNTPSPSTFRSLQRGQRVVEYKYNLYA